MTRDEIKQAVSMIEVVNKYGLRPNRAGFISCPFHKGDRTPSMKIYKQDYHCHACGANGDIFSFVMQMDNCDFKAAYKALGGSYSHSTDYQRNLHRYRLEKRKETALNKRAKALQEKAEINEQITLNKIFSAVYPVFSDEWCEAMNKLEYLFYRLELLTEERWY